VTHLEGVLTLVSDSGPWFRIQGRHVRPAGAKAVGLRLNLDHHSGITVDVHLGSAVWIRAGWYPAHTWCRAVVVNQTGYRGDHRCWGRWLPARVLQHGLA
jgi:hypothetical protein